MLAHLFVPTSSSATANGGRSRRNDEIVNRKRDALEASLERSASAKRWPERDAASGGSARATGAPGLAGITPRELLKSVIATGPLAIGTGRTASRRKQEAHVSSAASSPPSPMRTADKVSINMRHVKPSNTAD